MLLSLSLMLHASSGSWTCKNDTLCFAGLQPLQTVTTTHPGLQGPHFNQSLICKFIFIPYQRWVTSLDWRSKFNHLPQFQSWKSATISCLPSFNLLYKKATFYLDALKLYHLLWCDWFQKLHQFRGQPFSNWANFQQCLTPPPFYNK